jgi:ferredoxin-NADP reductase
VAVELAAAEPARIQFRPGQFVSLATGGAGSGDRRSFSITSAPVLGDAFELLLRPSGGGVTARFVAGLRPGDPVRYFGPMGYFLLDDRHEGDVVFAATGVGISAVWSMLCALLERPETGQVRLYWGMRRASEVFWQDRLEALRARSPRFRYQVLLSGEGQGRITAPVLESAAKLRSPVYYLCGNGQMVEDLRSGLIAGGLDRHRQVRTEVFHPAGVISPAP